MISPLAAAWIAQRICSAAFGRFWSVVRGALADDGRESYVEGTGEVVQWRLADGTCHRLIKAARAPADLTRLLTGLGWQASIWPSGPDWLLGHARPTV